MGINSIRVLGTRIDRVTYKDLLNKIDIVINNGMRCTICFLNPHMIIESTRNDELRQYINESEMVVADGIGILIAGKILGKDIPERVTGTDFMYHLAETSVRNGYKLYFLGAKPSIAGKAASNLLEKYPGLRIEGIHDGYFSAEDEDNIIEDINKKNTDILIVCLGVPKQEQWIRRNRSKLRAPVVFGNGAAFDFTAGSFKRAPVWIQKCGMEWIVRLVQEPRRLWKRYLVGNIYFLYLVIKQKLGFAKEF